MIGAPGRIRTCDPQIRNLVLYPAELRARWNKVISALALIRQWLTVLLVVTIGFSSTTAALAQVPMEVVDVKLLKERGQVKFLLTDGQPAIAAALTYPWPSGKSSDALLESANRELDSFLTDHAFMEMESVVRDRHNRFVGRIRTSRGNALDQFALANGLALVEPNVGNLPTETIAELLETEARARELEKGLWATDGWVFDAVEDIDRLTGRFAIVKGRILKAATAKYYLYLNFGGDWRSDFTVRVSKKQARKIKRSGVDLAELEGSDVAVRGWVFEENGPMIELLRVEQIEVEQ